MSDLVFVASGDDVFAVYQDGRQEPIWHSESHQRAESAAKILQVSADNGRELASKERQLLQAIREMNEGVLRLRGWNMWWEAACLQAHIMAAEMVLRERQQHGRNEKR
jgi:hypothetical protein